MVNRRTTARVRLLVLGLAWIMVLMAVSPALTDDLVLVAQGAPPFATVYGGSADDGAKDVRQTADGGYIMVGYSESFGLGAGDVWVLKVKADGELDWQKTYGGAGEDVATAVRQTTDGGYLVAGATDSFGAGDADGWLLKLDASGGVAWQKTYGGAQVDEFFALELVGSGCVVAGYTESSGKGAADVWVLELNGSGGIVWQKTYGDTSPEKANAVQPVSDGGYIVAGYTESYGQGKTEGWVLKLDAGGGLTWQRTYGGSQWDVFLAAQQTSDGGYVVAGYTYSYGGSGGDAWVLKLNVNGTVAWQKTYGGTGTDSAQSILQAGDGGYVLAGRTASFGVSGQDAWVLKLVGDGGVAWQMAYGGLGNDSGLAVQQTEEGGYIVAGETEAYSAGGSDAWLLKMGGDGVVTGICNLGEATNASVADSASAATGSSGTAGTSSVAPSGSSATGGSPTVSAAYVCFTTPALPFAATYGEENNDAIDAIAETRDGGYIAVGDSNQDGWVLKLEAGGGVVWQKIFGGTGWNGANSVQQTADGGYVVAGLAEQGSDSGYGWLLKLDANGSSTWSKFLGGADGDHLYKIEKTNDGGYVAAGYTSYGMSFEITNWVLKLEADGDITWNKSYRGDPYSSFSDIQQTGDGGYIAAGWLYDGAPNRADDCYVLKLQADGALSWQKTFGGSGGDDCTAIQQTGDGGYIVAGRTSSFGAGEADVWVLKLDSGGSVIWQKTYGGASRDWAESIFQTGDGGYLVTGFTASHGSVSMEDLWLLKLSADGSLQWSRTYAGQDDEGGYAARQTGDGGYLVAGSTSSFGAGGDDAWVLKLNADGTVCPGCTLGQAFTPTVADSSATVADPGMVMVDRPKTIKAQSLSVDNTDIEAAPVCACGLCLSKEVSPAEVAKDGTLVYTVVLSNSGSMAANTVAVTDTLPSEVTFQSWYEKPVGAQVSDDELIWNGTLGAGQMVTFAFRVDHVGNYGDVVANTARYASTMQAGSDEATFGVLGAGNLDIAKTVTPQTGVAYHGTVTYTISLGNHGQSDASVRLTDRLPPEVVFGRWLSGPLAQLEDGVLSWTGTVGAGEIKIFRFTAQHVGNLGDEVKNSAEYADVSGGGSDQATFRVEGYGSWVYLPLVFRGH